MSETNITTSHALLKEINSKTYQLLRLTDEMDITCYRLRQLHQAFVSICEELSRREG